MRTWHVLSLAGLTLVSVFFLALARPLVFGGWATLVDAQARVPSWQPATTATAIAGLALVVPVLVSLRIVTRQRVSAEDPEDYEAEFGGISQFAQDAIISIDAKGKILLWNTAAENMFGYSYEEMYGEALTKIIPQRYRDAHAQGLARVNADSEHHIIDRTVELAGLRENGQEFPLELSLSTWTAGHERYYGAIIRDITERKQAQEALQRSEEILRKLVETAPDAVVVIDVKGKILAWNPGAQHMFGYADSDAIGMNVTALMPERYCEAHRAGLDRLGSTGEARLVGKTVELHGVRRDGSEFPLQLSLGTWSAGEERFFSAVIREAGDSGGANSATAGAGL